MAEERTLLPAVMNTWKFGVRSADILLEMGRRKAVGGQEDLIEEVAISLSRAQV
jgi:DmpG-like communication domain